MVEQDHPVGQHERMVVRERADAGTEADVAGPLGRRRDEHLGGGDDLETGRVVLADPRLVEAELVQTGDELEVALERQRRVLTRGVKGGQEHTEA